MKTRISIVLPAKNEAEGLKTFLPELRAIKPDAEILVVNDGSEDDTVEICQQNNVKVVSHPYSMGNGAAIKTGARNASGDVLVFMDADGQHRPEDIPQLLEGIEEGYDLVVGARSRESQASLGRLCANTFYNWFATKMVGRKVQDLTSGFRAVDAKKFKEFLHLLPNGFSYPTTSTMAFFRSGYGVKYIPIKTNERIGTSHINVMKDGVRFLLILFKIGTLFSPLKIFLPFSLIAFTLGAGHYLHTYIDASRFTNMSALMFVTSLLVFLIGLVSEQITTLIYRDVNR